MAGAVALGAAGVLSACGGGDSDSTDTASQTPAGDESSSAGGDASSDSGDSGGGGGLVAAADVPVGGGLILAEQKLVITQPTEGTFNAFPDVCTHQGCPFKDVTETINCGCHGSQFSIEDGSNVTGPNGEAAGSVAALEKLTVSVDGDQLSVG